MYGPYGYPQAQPGAQAAGNSPYALPGQASPTPAYQPQTDPGNQALMAQIQQMIQEDQQAQAAAQALAQPPAKKQQSSGGGGLSKLLGGGGSGGGGEADVQF